MWTYNPADLVTTTTSGRVNTVRLLIGDTISSDPQLQDEELTFVLSETNDNCYQAAAFACRLLASKYARMVNTQLDGALEAEYSDRILHYTKLAIQMSDMAKKFSGKALGVSAGGIKISEMIVVEENTDRVKPAFKVGQFDV